jgi:hypothetical protein
VVSFASRIRNAKSAYWKYLTELVDGDRDRPAEISSYYGAYYLVPPKVQQPIRGPLPHRHDREKEVFTVLESAFEFYSDGVWSPFSGR